MGEMETVKANRAEARRRVKDGDQRVRSQANAVDAESSIVSDP